MSGIAGIWINLIRSNFRMMGLDESKPRGIIILGILIGLGAAGQLLVAIVGQLMMILGNVLLAETAIYTYIFYVLVSVGIAYGFLKLKKAAFYLSILWFLWGAGNGYISYLVLPDIEILVDGVLSIVFFFMCFPKGSIL